MYVCKYVWVYVCMDVWMKCMYVVCLYAHMHYFCIIAINVWDFVHKYLCNIITDLHIMTKCASTDTYCSSCSVPTCYSNVTWTDSTLTVCSQLSVSFCTARRNYNEAQYAISWQLNCTWREDTSLTDEFLEFCVICKCKVWGCYQLRYKLRLQCSQW